VAVTEDDVRHVASLARLALSDARITGAVVELNKILDHMAVLAHVKTGKAAPIDGVGSGGMPLRTDAGPPYPLARPLGEFAPLVRERFLLVPRLATHEDPVADDSGENELNQGLKDMADTQREAGE
jgi:aspartyl-tRNA(Asn)/glutamyl-tRNA(Gln) amidotransferase subunit C